MSDKIEGFYYKDHLIRIYHDSDPLNPREEWDNFGSMVFLNKHYRSPDKCDQLTMPELWQEYGSREELHAIVNAHIAVMKRRGLKLSDIKYELINAGENDSFVIDHELSDHPFKQFPDAIFAIELPSAWFRRGSDSGYIYCTREKAEKEFTTEWLTAQGKTLEQCVMALLQSEIDTYDAYVNGDCYGFKIFKTMTDEHGHTYTSDDATESCWGFYDLDECKQEAKRMLD